MYEIFIDENLDLDINTVNSILSQNFNIEFNNYSIYATISLIGIFTVYFHGTLSLMGQLLDEFSILALLLLFDINHVRYLMFKICIGFILFIKFSFFNL